MSVIFTGKIINTHLSFKFWSIFICWTSWTTMISINMSVRKLIKIIITFITFYYYFCIRIYIDYFWIIIFIIMYFLSSFNKLFLCLFLWLSIAIFTTTFIINMIPYICFYLLTTSITCYEKFCFYIFIYYLRIIKFITMDFLSSFN